MSTVADLWAVQVTDLAIEADRRRLAEIEAQLGETGELLVAREAAAKSEAELEQWRQRQSSIETEVRDLSARIKAAEQQLMSGRVRNPKELEGMQANVASLKRHRSDLETEVLEAMLEIDRCREELAGHQAHLATVDAAWQAEQAALLQERGRLQAELQALAERLKRRWAAISPQDKELYRELRSRKAGRALALLDRNSCQACGVGVPTSVAQHARAEGERVFCPSCGRLLHAAGS